MSNPKSFRSIEEIKKFLKSQHNQLQLDKQVVDKTIRQLASMTPKRLSAAELKLLDISGDSDGSAPKRKRTMNVDFPVVKVPNMEQLTGHYTVAERLSEQFKFLLNVENEMKMNFKGSTVKDATSQSYQEAVGALNKLKDDVQETLDKLLKSMRAVAAGHAPKQYTKFVDALAQELSNKDHLECEKVESYTYAAVAKDGELIFAGYLCLLNAINDQGKVAPRLYIVVRWTVGGDVEIFIEHEFMAPTLLKDGIVVENLREAGKAIDSQLTLEGFSTQIGTLPVSMQIREPAGGLRREAFSAKEAIKDVKAEKDKLIFELNTNDAKKIDEIKYQLFLEVKAIIKNKRDTTVTMSPTANPLVFTFSNLKHSDGIHPADLEFLEEKYRLNQGQLRRLSNVINGG